MTNPSLESDNNAVPPAIETQKETSEETLEQRNERRTQEVKNMLGMKLGDKASPVTDAELKNAHIGMWMDKNLNSLAMAPTTFNSNEYYIGTIMHENKIEELAAQIQSNRQKIQANV